MIRGLVGLLLACLVSISCTPTRSTIKPPYPYRGQEFSAEEIAQVANETCAIEPGPATEIHPFTTDGCSMWPDGSWRECCIEHDIQYWCASSDPSRKQADRRLRQCAREKSNGVNAFLIWLGTRLGGPHWLPFPWRWGYGYSWLQLPKAPETP